MNLDQMSGPGDLLGFLGFRVLRFLDRCAVITMGRNGSEWTGSLNPVRDPIITQHECWFIDREIMTVGSQAQTGLLSFWVSFWVVRIRIPSWRATSSLPHQSMQHQKHLHASHQKRNSVSIPISVWKWLLVFIWFESVFSVFLKTKTSWMCRLWPVSTPGNLGRRRRPEKYWLFAIKSILSKNQSPKRIHT